jgi:chloramphenicol 3-O phosphotransferase
LQEWLEECVALLSSFPVLFVGVRCDLTEVSRREQDEKKVAGLARMQSKVVHAHGIYDLEVDTCEFSPEACARAIQNMLEKGWAPTAFQLIREKRAAGTLWS